jgi:FkbM family methyltransferase
VKKYIIDVGSSSDGGHGLDMSKRTGIPVIFIEPNKEALDKLKSNENDIKLNLAITSYDGEVEFNYYQEGTHSILETNLDEIHKFIDGYSGRNADPKDWVARKKEIVKCCKLSTIIKQFEIDEVFYLKIDTQGHDFEAIKSIEDQLYKVNTLECEVQLTDFEIYKNQSKKTELVEYLLKNDFILVSSNQQTFGQEENLIFKNGRL